jgi:hypothetical protein
MNSLQLPSDPLNLAFGDIYSPLRSAIRPGSFTFQTTKELGEAFVEDWSQPYNRTTDFCPLLSTFLLFDLQGALLEPITPHRCMHT